VHTFPIDATFLVDGPTATQRWHDSPPGHVPWFLEERSL